MAVAHAIWMFRLKRVVCCVNCVLEIIIRIQHLAMRMGYSSDVLLYSWHFENCEVLLCISVIRTRGCLRYCFLFGPALSSHRSLNTPPVLPPAGRQGSFPIPPRQSTSYTCFSCGYSDHTRSKCRFRNPVSQLQWKWTYCSSL